MSSERSVAPSERAATFARSSSWRLVTRALTLSAYDNRMLSSALATSPSQLPKQPVPAHRPRSTNLTTAEILPMFDSHNTCDYSTRQHSHKQHNTTCSGMHAGVLQVPPNRFAS